MNTKVNSFLFETYPLLGSSLLLGELGRFPLSVIAKERSLKFWMKLKNNTNSPMYKMYK